MLDRYTKAVLTVIAISLAWIAFGPYLLPPATAQLNAAAIRIDGISPHQGMIPVVIRAIDRGAVGRWDALKVARVD